LWSTVLTDINDGARLIGKTIKIRGKVLECKGRTLMLPSNAFDETKGGFQCDFDKPLGAAQGTVTIKGRVSDIEPKPFSFKAGWPTIYMTDCEIVK